MNNSPGRKALAADTMRVLERQHYMTPGGKIVDLAEPMRACLDATRFYEPADLEAMLQQVLAAPAKHAGTTLEVSGETSLEAAARLSKESSGSRIGVLNYASAKNAGGGFLNGAQAQEESLTRSSALYPSLLLCPEFYAFHRAQKTCVYSDRMILSPGCPVFRDDSGTLLEEPHLVDFLTSPAPNAGAIKRNEPQNEPQIVPALRERGAKVLALAAHHGCEVLVLGAWGCGVFANDPEAVAEMFAGELLPGARFHGRFERVAFAVLDKSPNQATLAAFEKRFAKI